LSYRPARSCCLRAARGDKPSFYWAVAHPRKDAHIIRRAVPATLAEPERGVRQELAVAARYCGRRRTADAIARASPDAGHPAAASDTFIAMKTMFLAALLVTALAAPATLAGQTPSGNKLAVFGDITYFFGQGKPNNCFTSNRYKRGEPVGFRMTAVDPATGKRDRTTQLVVHLTYGGKTLDLPMRDRQTEQQPEREFWVLKWIVPDDAPLGAVKYTVTARDAQGRTGEFKPFEVAASQLTIIE
jgi:hypothetical protein